VDDLIKDLEAAQARAREAEKRALLWAASM
jgi:hypothetical protein